MSKILTLLSVLLIAACGHTNGPHMRALNSDDADVSGLCDAAEAVVQEMEQIDRNGAQLDVVACTTFAEDAGRVIIVGHDGANVVDMTLIMARTNGRWVIIDAAPILRVSLSTLQFQWLTRQVIGEPYGGRDL